MGGGASLMEKIHSSKDSKILSHEHKIQDIIIIVQTELVKWTPPTLAGNMCGRS